VYNHGFSFISIFQKVDIAIGAITVTWLRSTAVDFSVPYFEAGVGFLANIPRKLSKWAALLRPYRLAVWLALLATILLAGPLCWWISKQNARTENEAMTLQQSYEMIYKIFIFQGKL
jgi:hypothetical protein